MYHINTRERILSSVYRNVGWAFYFVQKKGGEFLMIGLGAIGGIFIVIGTALGAIDDLTNKK